MHYSTLLTTTAVLAAGVVSAHKDPPMDPKHPFSVYPYENSWRTTTGDGPFLKHAASKEPRAHHPHHHHTAGGRPKGKVRKTHRARQEAATTPETEVAATASSSASTSRIPLDSDMPPHTRAVSLTVVLNGDATTATSGESVAATATLSPATSVEPTTTEDPSLRMKRAKTFGTAEEKKISMIRASATDFEEPEPKPTVAPIILPIPIPIPKPKPAPHHRPNSDTEDSDDSTSSSTDTVYLDIEEVPTEHINVSPRAVTVTVTKTRTLMYDPLVAGAVFTPGPKEKEVTIDAQLVVPTVDMDNVSSLLASIYATVTPEPQVARAAPEVPHSIVTIGTHTIDLADVWTMLVPKHTATKVARETASSTSIAPVVTVFRPSLVDPEDTSPHDDESSPDGHSGGQA